MTVKPFLELFDWLWLKRKKKRRILIVEDNPSDAELLLFCLRQHGYEATVAETAEAARALIARNSLSIIFVDMRLTYMNGWELVSIIWKYSPKSLVVVVAGMMDDLLKIKSFDRPLVVLQKPPTVSTVGEILIRFKDPYEK